MVAAVGQNFTTYAGDDIQPVFTVKDGTTPQGGNAVDISNINEIVWSLARTVGGTPILTKRKSTAGIVFVTNGTDGQFSVLITHNDTAALAGTYFHTSVVTDPLGNVATVALGTMNVGRPPTWSYDPTQLFGQNVNPVYQVRRLIGDVLSNDQQMFDEEINFQVSINANIYRAAAGCCRDISSQYARKVDIVEQDKRTAYSAQARNYEMRAKQLDRIATLKGNAVPYMGAVSIMDKVNQVTNNDRTPPQFNLGFTDNYLPVAPAGNEDISGGPTPETFP